VNWIEIDKILHELYSSWNGKDKNDYYKTVEQRFKWDRRQAVVATDLIFKQRLTDVNASSSGNDLAEPKKAKATKKDSTTVASGKESRSLSTKTRSGPRETSSGQKRSTVGNKPAARPQRKPKTNQ
jgi:hypothetical protein